MFGLSDNERLWKRLKGVESALADVEDDIAALTRLVRSINSRYAIGAQSRAKSPQTPEGKLLAEILGGKGAHLLAIADQEPDANNEKGKSDA